MCFLYRFLLEYNITPMLNYISVTLLNVIRLLSTLNKSLSVLCVLIAVKRIELCHVEYFMN